MQQCSSKLDRRFMVKIIIGSDHAALSLKNEIKKHLSKLYNIEDMSVPDDATNSDYPNIAKLVCDRVANNKDTFGILICGTGIGMSIAANKQVGIRCALCMDEYSAKMSRQHNDANILALGQRTIGSGLAISIVDAYLNENFSNESRHINRLQLIDKNYQPK